MGRWWRLSVAVVLGWLLILAGAGALAVMWLSTDPVDTAQIIGTVVALVVMISGGCAVLWRWSRSAVPRLPRLGEVELTHLGVRVPRERSRVSRDQLPYASRQLLDPQLRDALRERRFVLVHGPSASGKSRSTAEAARALYGDRPVLVPDVRPGALTRELDRGVVRDRTVVWLDDVDRHIGAGVNAMVLQRLLEVDGVIIVATIRAAAYEQVKAQGELRPPGSDIVELAILHRGLVEFTGWDAADRECATQQYADQPDVVDALDNGMGLGEYLTAGPELVDRIESGAPPAGGVAVVRAAADWYRVGLTRPAPLDVVRKLYPLYLPPDDATLLDRFDEAVRWASTPVSGARLVTQRTDGTGLVVHDYYLDHVFAHPLDTIAPKVWDTLAEELATSPEDQCAVGVVLYAHSLLLDAERWFRAAAAGGNSLAMNNLGAFWSRRGDPVQAERWYRPAAEAGHTLAMANLGATLAGRGDMAGAKKWTRAAANAGSTDAKYNLGLFLMESGDAAGAERWTRAAAESGHPRAMNNLALLLDDQGQVVDAERWSRAAVDAGNVNAMNTLGNILARQGDSAEVEQWYRAAANKGNAYAMCNLGNLMERRGDLVEAERWLRWAANDGVVEAMNDLAVLLHQQGNSSEAERLYRAAANEGHTEAMDNLGLLLEEQGDVEAAEHWYRAADAGRAD